MGTTSLLRTNAFNPVITEQVSKVSKAKGDPYDESLENYYTTLPPSDELLVDETPEKKEPISQRISHKSSINRTPNDQPLVIREILREVASLYNPPQELPPLSRRDMKVFVDNDYFFRSS